MQLYNTLFGGGRRRPYIIFRFRFLYGFMFVYIYMYVCIYIYTIDHHHTVQVDRVKVQCLRQWLDEKAPPA